MLLDGEQVYEPAITTYLNHRRRRSEHHRSAPASTKDVYLTLEPGCRARWHRCGDPGLREADDPVAVDRRGVMAIGTVLAAFPGKRRRATDPVSALIATPDLIASAARNDAPLAAGADDD